MCKEGFLFVSYCMKKTVCIFVAFIAVLTVAAQNEIAWNVCHDKKKLFSSSIENEEQNNLVVNLSDLRPGKDFIITYQGVYTPEQKGQWKRTIGIYTAADKELYRTDSAVLKISDLQLKKFLQGNKTIKVYTWALPKDPKEAARVRVRRVHLCTIMLKQ